MILDSMKGHALSASLLSPTYDTRTHAYFCLMKNLWILHFTPSSLRRGDNGNESRVHWDMVNIQREEWGGGEIWFDNELIRKDGKFVIDDLSKLNPDYLLGT